MPANLGCVLLQLCHHVLKIHTDEYKMIHKTFLTKGSLLWIFSMGTKFKWLWICPGREIRANRCDCFHLGRVGYGAQVSEAPPLGRVGNWCGTPPSCRRPCTQSSCLVWTTRLWCFLFISRASFFSVLKTVTAPWAGGFFFKEAMRTLENQVRKVIEIFNSPILQFQVRETNGSESRFGKKAWHLKCILLQIAETD